MKKDNYQKPEIEIIEIDATDVVASGPSVGFGGRGENIEFQSRERFWEDAD